MYDELELDKLGDRKTALFLIMSDTDSTFNFLISMIYTDFRCVQGRFFKTREIFLWNSLTAQWTF